MFATDTPTHTEKFMLYSIACFLSKNQLTNYIWAKLSAELDKTNLKLEECSKILASHVNTSLKDVNQDHKDVEE